MISHRKWLTRQLDSLRKLKSVGDRDADARLVAMVKKFEQELGRLQELEHLANSHARLRAAQARFRDCIRSIKDGVENKTTGKDSELEEAVFPKL